MRTRTTFAPQSFPDPLREITVRIETGKIVRLVTNDLDAPASEIADLYKARWQVEPFFKWLKQNLRRPESRPTAARFARLVRLIRSGDQAITP